MICALVLKHVLQVTKEALRVLLLRNVKFNVQALLSTELTVSQRLIGQWMLVITGREESLGNRARYKTRQLLIPKNHRKFLKAVPAPVEVQS